MCLSGGESGSAPSREHPFALDALDGFLVRCRFRPGGPRRLHLAELRQIGVAQDKADVRMSNETAILIDDIGPSAFSHLGLRDDVPDEREVDLSKRDASLATCARNRER